MENRDGIAQSYESLRPDKLGRDNSYHLFFDKGRFSSSATNTSDESRKFSELALHLAKKKSQSVVHNVDADSDLSKLSSKALIKLASTVTKKGLKKTISDLEETYTSMRSFKMMNVALLIYQLILAAVVSVILTQNWEQSKEQICFSKCMRIRTGAVYYFSFLLYLSLILVTVSTVYAFKAFNKCSRKYFMTIKILYVICVVAWILSFNVIAIPIGSYLLFNSLQLSETSKKLSALNRFRTHSI